MKMITADNIINYCDQFVKSLPEGMQLYVGLTYCEANGDLKLEENLSRLNCDMPDNWLFRKVGDAAMAEAAYNYFLRNGAMASSTKKISTTAIMHYLILYGAEKK